MKKLFFVLLLLPVLVFPQKAGDNIFSGIKVHTIKLFFNQPAYWDSLTTYFNEGNEQYLAASAVINGLNFDSIGIRLKGHSAYNHPNNKKPMRIAFDEFKNLTWDGIKGVHLNNCWEDPTFMREKLHLDYLNNAGIAASRGNFAQLYINDTLFAFYSLAEHVDKTFLSSRYSNKSGDLFKAVDGVGSPSYYSDFRWYGTDSSFYEPRYELKSDGSITAWSRMMKLIDTLNYSSNLAVALPALINDTSVYKAFSTDILLGNLDSYVNSCRNFYFYYNTDKKKFEWIFWDAGLSFGSFNQSGVNNIEDLSIFYVVNAAQRPLMGKILATPQLRTSYLNTFTSLFNSYFIPSDLFNHIDSIANVIRPYVYADAKKMYTDAQFESNIQNDILIGTTRKPGLKSFITSRYNNITAQLTSVEDELVNPLTFSLDQNYPNPFNPATTISFSVAREGYVKLEVHNLLGESAAILFNGYAKPGVKYEVIFNAEKLSSGIYLYRLTGSQNSLAKKMILIK